MEQDWEESMCGKKWSKIDTIGDAYIMVAWLNEGLDPGLTKSKACNLN